MGPVHHLPDVGDQRRQDQQGRSLGRRQHDRQQAHRDRGQTQADNALGEAGQHENRQDEHENGRRHGPHMAGDGTVGNVENTEYAFVLYEG